MTYHNDTCPWCDSYIEWECPDDPWFFQARCEECGRLVDKVDIDPVFSQVEQDREWARTINN